ncbi:hypothetical protein MASR1M12_23920 [Erysipelotrichia bacterium]
MEIITNVLRGIVIGIANIIPGVSGGTMALVLGIYSRLLNAISSIGPQTLNACRNGFTAIKEELRRIDFMFLASLATGAGIAIVVSARIMTNLLENHHDPTYGFFFGLVMASALIPFRMIRKFSAGSILSGLVAAALVVGLTMAYSGEDRLEAARKKASIKGETVVTPASGTVDITTQTDTKFKYDGGMAFFFVAASSSCRDSARHQRLFHAAVDECIRILVCINEFQIVPLAFFIPVPSSACWSAQVSQLSARQIPGDTMAFLVGLVIGSLYAIWPFKTTILQPAAGSTSKTSCRPLSAATKC